jgi:hypothetical protein
MAVTAVVREVVDRRQGRPIADRDWSAGAQVRIEGPPPVNLQRSTPPPIGMLLAT